MDLTPVRKSQESLCLVKQAPTAPLLPLKALPVRKLQSLSSTKTRSILILHSSFFSTAFNSNFIEGMNQEMTLDVDLKAFGIIANWMYTQDIVASSGELPDL
jgi:hypothetical protein